MGAVVAFAAVFFGAAVFFAEAGDLEVVVFFGKHVSKCTGNGIYAGNHVSTHLGGSRLSGGGLRGGGFGSSGLGGSGRLCRRLFLRELYWTGSAYARSQY